MIKISGIELYVGTHEEFAEASKKGMSILCARNNGQGGPSYRSVAGVTKAGDPDYLYKIFQGNVYLNLIDGKDPKYIADEMIDTGLNYMHSSLNRKEQLFVYCSLGESRSPSMAFMYLMEYGYLNKEVSSVTEFRRMYPAYNPGQGIKEYIIKRYKLKV